MFIEKLALDDYATPRANGIFTSFQPAGVEYLFWLFRCFYKHATSLRSVTMLVCYCYKYVTSLRSVA